MAILTASFWRQGMKEDLFPGPIASALLAAARMQESWLRAPFSLGWRCAAALACALLPKQGLWHVAEGADAAETDALPMQ